MAAMGGRVWSDVARTVADAIAALPDTAPIPARTRDDLTMYLADADESGVSDFWGTVDAYERP